MSNFVSSAPGSVMLFGEHAVLRGYPAITLAIDKRVTARLTPRSDDVIRITTPIFGEHLTTRDAIEVVEPFTFVLAVLQMYEDKLPSGADIEIESDFSSNLGLGSSAAVTVAMLGVVYEWLKSHNPLSLTFSPGSEGEGTDFCNHLLEDAIHVIRTVQGLGSGADAAASVYGGAVYFDPQNSTVTKLDGLPPIALLYSGHKEPTAKVVQRVETKRQRYPVIMDRLYHTSEQLCVRGRDAINTQDWGTLGALANVAQGLMISYGVHTPKLQSLLNWLHVQPTTKGAKISGAGMGDCVVAIGEFESGAHQQMLDVRGSMDGVTPSPLTPLPQGEGNQ